MFTRFSIRQHVVAVCLTVLALGSCGQWRRVGSTPAADPNLLVPKMFDPTTAYGNMGFITHGEPLPFVAAIRYLAGANPDSSLGLLSLTFSNRSLSFRRGASDFSATYRVDAVFRGGEGEEIARVSDAESVTVASFRETLGDSRIVYQDFISVPPGATALTIRVEDVRSGVAAQSEASVEVRRFTDRPSLSSLIPVIGGVHGRSTFRERPDLRVNPRATVPYGRDTVKFYIEGYRTHPRAGVTLNVFSVEQANLVLSQNAELVGGGDVRSVVFEVDGAELPVGQLRFEAVLEDGLDTTSTRVLVSLSDQWIATNFADMLSLLRYFTSPETLNAMREATGEERITLWREFWEVTDPDMLTAQHEGLIDYFARLNEANELFPETRLPGWLTDRGEIFITLGMPDETFEPFPDPQSPIRILRWTYITERLVLQFVDQTGLDDFRLTDRSRADYQRILNRLRAG